ncbi:MAG: indole-3-pyruvate monooxygenase [Bradymonadia bacterium]|jgi:indole-3-pyruvate monooxygenase
MPSLANRGAKGYGRGMPRSAETLIIGAGPSGLAVAGSLRQSGLDFVQIDQAPAIAWQWRRHYARLHLHTTRELSGLPGLPFPERYPQYPSRAQVVEYLDAYAAHFGLAPVLNTRVERATRHAGGWRVTTDAGAWQARSLVIASGYNAVPHRPAFKGEFAGRVVHSAEYQDGAPFKGQRVVVVGCGNSGAEIALDLFEHGAAQVTLIVRGPRYVTPRDVYGLAAQSTSIMLGRLPRRLGDAIGRVASRLAMGDMTRYGFRRPDAGPLTEVDLNGRVALVDVGTVALIKQGVIRTAPGIARLEAQAVICVDGQRIDADAMVLATGYRAGISRFLDDAEVLLDERGLPRVHGRPGAAPSLYFCGFRNPSTGALRESGVEAARIASALARSAGAGRSA